MKNADVTWNDNTLSKYLTDPKAFIPGDKMPSWASRIQASSGTCLPICIKQPNKATWGTLELDEPEVLRFVCVVFSTLVANPPTLMVAMLSPIVNILI